LGQFGVPPPRQDEAAQMIAESRIFFGPSVVRCWKPVGL